MNTQVGATRQALTKAMLMNWLVPVPPIDDQRRIVAEIEKHFTRLDARVAALRRVQANLKSYRAAVLKAACEGRLVPTEAELARKENRTYESGSELVQRILADNPGRPERSNANTPVSPKGPPLPSGWVWARVEQISDVVRGASPRPAGDPRYFGGNIPWITVGPITANGSPYLNSVPETLTQAGRERSRYIEPHTLLLTNSGATLGVPKISVIGGCMNDGVATLLNVDYPLKLYLLYFVRTQTDRLRGVNQGAAQPNLNTTIIKGINVPLPPLAEQTRIVAEVERRGGRVGDGGAREPATGGSFAAGDFAKGVCRGVMMEYGGLVFVIDEPKRTEKLHSRLGMGREFSGTFRNSGAVV